MEMRLLLCSFATLLLIGQGSAGPPIAPIASGVCWVMGDPHYRTFDGTYFNFMGSCSYILAKNTEVDATHPAFEVITKNDKTAESHLTSVGEVTINVYGFEIKMFRREFSMVWINGKVWNLPATFESPQGEEIKLLQSGLSVVIWTDFGLTVQYDWKEYVRVTVPSSFMGRVGGLCGNFDKDKVDLTTSEGTIADSIQDFGKSWRVPNQKDEQDCTDKCTGNCGTCSWWRRGKADVFCGLMTPVLNWAFKPCHAVIESKVIFDMCKFDYCQNGDMKDYLCNILGVYTDACQRAGVKVHDWRHLMKCPVPTCPENSHFEYCGNACPATCENPSAPSTCKTPCVQTCTCNDGYFRSGNKCIRQEQCGCQYKNTYLQPRQSIWADGCTEQITCTMGQIKSEKKSCGLGEKCGVKNGITSCQGAKSAKCSISGDPHYVTFDNVKYDFMGTCTYTAAEGCHFDGSNLTPFSVVVENEKWYALSDDPKVSVAKLVAVKVYGNTIILRRNQVGLVMVNGAIMNLPVSLNEGQVVVQQIGTNDVITTDFGLIVTYDLVYHVTVTVPGTYAGKTCGLCGNFNGNQNDDFQLPDGQITKDVTAFGSAWKVGVSGVVCENGCVGDNCPKCPENQRAEIEKDCSIITNPNGPFAACQAVIDPAPYYRDCVYDVCVAGLKGGIQMLCHSINAYVIDCQDVGVKILEWRTPNLCPMTCPANSHYSICAAPCETPCPGLTKVTCSDTCAEGCACNTGYYFNGTGCVPQEECSCYIDGKTLKIGETVVADDCSAKYICPKSGRGHIEDMSCNIDESCQVKNGVRACFPKQCSMTNTGVFTTFHGVAGDVTESGMYDLVKICNEAMVESWFRIVLDLQTCGETGKMSTVGIVAFFEDATIVINSIFEILINGKTALLPIQMKNGVSFEISNEVLIIKMESAFTLTYSQNQDVTVTVSETVARSVCGACGQLTDMTLLPENSLQSYMSWYKASVFNFCL